MMFPRCPDQRLKARLTMRSCGTHKCVPRYKSNNLPAQQETKPTRVPCRRETPSGQGPRTKNQEPRTKNRGPTPDGRPTTESRRLAPELLINLDLISRRQSIGLVGHADHGHQLAEHLVGHPFL